MIRSTGVLTVKLNHTECSLAVVSSSSEKHGSPEPSGVSKLHMYMSASNSIPLDLLCAHTHKKKEGKRKKKQEKRETPPYLALLSSSLEEGLVTV